LPSCCICAWVNTMARKDWSAADELEWRTVARHGFLAHGVEANLAEDLTQETLLRLLRGQRREQLPTRAYLYRVCQSVLCDHRRQCAREPNCQPLCCDVTLTKYECKERRAVEPIPVLPNSFSPMMTSRCSGEAIHKVGVTKDIIYTCSDNKCKERNS